MPPRTPHAIHEGDVGIHAYAGAGAGLGGELKTVPEDFIVTELSQDGREVMLEDPDGAGEDAVADEEEDEWDDEQLVKFVLRKEKQDTLGAVADLAELHDCALVALCLPTSAVSKTVLECLVPAMTLPSVKRDLLI